MKGKYQLGWFNIIYSIIQDVAASEFYNKDQQYDLDFKNDSNDGSKIITSLQLSELYKAFVQEFPIVSIEDPFDQDDW